MDGHQIPSTHRFYHRVDRSPDTGHHREARVLDDVLDGSLMIECTGAGIVLISPTGERPKYVLQIYFPASNNAAEYEALLHGLRIAISLGIRLLAVRSDSELIINQVQKEYSCTSTKISAYC